MIDPDGRSTSPIYDSKTGGYLGNDSQGFLKGEVLFMNKEKFDSLSKSSKTGIIDHDVATKNSSSISKLASTDANILLFNKASDHISKTLYKHYYNVDPTKELAHGTIETMSMSLERGTEHARGFNGNDVYGNYHNTSPNVELITNNFDKRKTLNTAANIFSNFEHEFRGHGGKANFNINLRPSQTGYDFLEHKEIYKMQLNSKNFQFTSGEYRQHIINQNTFYGTHQ